MILKSIELNNFMCYYGQNKFDFTEGLNVIIGDNGYGKSKLYDAFYWVMYDQCFNTSKKKFEPTKLLKKLIVSDRAIKEIGEGTITASVKLTFHHQEKDNIYIIERAYDIQKIGDEIRETNESREIIYEKELSYLNAKEVHNPDYINLIKNSILPDNIKPYMWFQGEQVESIIDFNKQDTLTQAINVLSNISKYDGIKSLADSLYESAAAEINRKLRALSKDKGRSEQLELERQAILEKLKGLRKQELQLKDNLAKAEEKSDILINKISDAQTIRELEEKRKSIEKQLEQVASDLSQEQLSFHKKMFINKWVLKGCEELFTEFSAKYDQYDANKLKKEIEAQTKINAEKEMLAEFQIRLPIDVPEPIYVERMLKDERCLVCDREAKIDTEPWQKIKELLDRQILKTKIPQKATLHDFRVEFKKLYQNGLGLQSTIVNIDNDVNATLAIGNKLNARRKNLAQELETIQRQIQSLISDVGIDANQAKDLLNNYTTQNDYAKSFSRQVSDIDHNISKYQERLDAIELEFKSLAVGELPKSLTIKSGILKDFKDIAESTRNIVFNQLVKMLEAEANIHYGEMTKGNLSAKGIIRLKELSNGNFMPELVDGNGNILLQLNTGNIILIKLATIMAIISARQGTRATDLYTLITDAPMSVFGEDYTIGFCKTVSKVYRQSIIMSKEFYRNEKLREDLLTNPEIKLGKVYLITPSIPEADRMNRESLSTNIAVLN